MSNNKEQTCIISSLWWDDFCKAEQKVYPGCRKDSAQHETSGGSRFTFLLPQHEKFGEAFGIFREQKPRFIHATAPGRHCTVQAANYYTCLRKGGKQGGRPGIHLSKGRGVFLVWRTGSSRGTKRSQASPKQELVASNNYILSGGLADLQSKGEANAIESESEGTHKVI